MNVGKPCRLETWNDQSTHVKRFFVVLGLPNLRHADAGRCDFDVGRVRASNSF